MKNKKAGEQTGYEWVDPKDSYNEDGTLKEGLYDQAIFFSDNGTYDPDNDYNMGSSTVTVIMKMIRQINIMCAHIPLTKIITLPHLHVYTKHLWKYITEKNLTRS